MHTRSCDTHLAGRPFCTDLASSRGLHLTGITQHSRTELNARRRQLHCKVQLAPASACQSSPRTSSRAVMRSFSHRRLRVREMPAREPAPSTKAASASHLAVMRWEVDSCIPLRIQSVESLSVCDAPVSACPEQIEWAMQVHSRLAFSADIRVDLSLWPTSTPLISGLGLRGPETGVRYLSRGRRTASQTRHSHMRLLQNLHAPACRPHPWKGWL